ncbi:MAG: hypothetical protein EPO42_10265 [Gallionellaceae bacterium]|nr:MAG: hypothetical protein EPO42_10265 [Gallionellaceae bacterium]
MSEPFIPFYIFILALVAGLPCTESHAVGIGEPTLHSGLGEPLHATVELRLGPGEQIEDNCLSLVAAEDAGSGADSGFLRTLTVKLAANNRAIEIRSRKAFNEPYAMFRLRIECPGPVNISKSITLLPELKTEPAPAAFAAPDQPSEAAPATAEAVAAPLNKPKVIETKLGPEVAPAEKPGLKMSVAAPAKREVRKRRSTRFRLKLSGVALDMSRVGKLGEGDKQISQMQQKLLDEDDQTAKFLAMQHQIKQMRDELTEIRLKLAQLTGNPSAAPAPAVAAMAPATPPNKARDSLIAAGLLVTLVLTVFYLRAQTRRKTPAIGEPEPVDTPGTVQYIAPAPAPVTALPTAAKNTPATPAPVEPPPAPAVDPEQELEASVLEEAELYAIYGHPDKAVKVLKEYLTQHVASENAWLLLLSIHSSCGLATEFENAARAFKRHNPNSGLWATVQALGRTLDKHLQLYTDEAAQSEPAPWLPYLSKRKHLPLGDILVELGHLSPEDMRNCLQDFDPKLHGRFGNYLLTKRMVSHAQLNEALLVQQGSGEAGLPEGGLPSLQQVESLLSGFDPARDGSVEDYLMAHQSDVAERLETSLPETADSPGEQTAKLPAYQAETDKSAQMDFVPNLNFPLPEKQKIADSKPESLPITLDFEPQPATRKNY